MLGEWFSAALERAVIPPKKLVFNGLKPSKNRPPRNRGFCCGTGLAVSANLQYTCKNMPKSVREEENWEREPKPDRRAAYPWDKAQTGAGITNQFTPSR